MLTHHATRKFNSIHPFDRKMFVRFALGVFIFAGFISGSFLVSQPQDNRHQAATLGTGPVEIRPGVGAGVTSFVAKRPTSLNLQLNTYNLPIIGVQLVYSINSAVLPSFSADQIVIPPNSGFTTLFKNVTRTTSGYNVQLALRPSGSINPSLTYSNNSFTDIVQMTLIPSGQGSISLNFVPTQTTSLTANSTNVLKPVASFTIPVLAEPTPVLLTTPTPVSQPTGVPQKTATPKPTRTKAPVTGTPGRMRGGDPITPVMIPFN